MSVDDSKGFVWLLILQFSGAGNHWWGVIIELCAFIPCALCFIIFIDKHFICILQEISHIAANSSVKLIRLVEHINCFSMTLGLVHSPVLAFPCVHASFLVLEQLSPLILCGPSFISETFASFLKLLGCSVCYMHVCTIVLLNFHI